MALKIFLPVLMIVMISACGPAREGSKEEEELLDEVMAIHDEAMPRMEQIMNHKETIRNRIDSLVKAGGVQPEDTAALSGLFDELDRADDAMMDWMRNFKPHLEKMSQEEAVNYLNEQKREMERVRDEMQQALEKAESML